MSKTKNELAYDAYVAYSNATNVPVASFESFEQNHETFLDTWLKVVSVVSDYYNGPLTGCVTTVAA